MNLKMYKRDCLLGALGAFLMLVGDLCLSVIPASAGDSGLFAREACLNGSWEGWRLPLLPPQDFAVWRSDFSPCAHHTYKLTSCTARPARRSSSAV